MDLSPKLLTDVQFRERWRGYSPDEVDEFLERVAAGVGELQQRLAEAVERASAAERRLLERSDEDEIRRTLVLAQRTAVASVEEARAEADRLVSETEDRCRQLVADAEAQASQLDAEIADRRRVELGDLSEQRAALQRDIERLRTFLDGERQRLGAVLRGQLELLERGFALAEPPALSEVVHASPPTPAEMPTIEPVEVEEPFVEPVDVEEPFVAEEEPASAVDELRLAREELADALRRAGVERDDIEDVAGDELGQVPRGPVVFDDREDTATHDALVDEPADQPMWRDDAAAASDEDDDPFLAELRRAVVDTEPLGPRDHDHDPMPTTRDADDEDDAPATGLFRRGRRRS